MDEAMRGNHDGWFYSNMTAIGHSLASSCLARIPVTLTNPMDRHGRTIKYYKRGNCPLAKTIATN
jgi:hypothetical protein